MVVPHYGIEYLLNNYVYYTKSVIYVTISLEIKDLIIWAFSKNCQFKLWVLAVKWKKVPTFLQPINYGICKTVGVDTTILYLPSCASVVMQFF